MWIPITYDDSYFDSMLEMSIENFGPENDICNSDFLNHQYFDNPAGNALIELAVDQESGTLAGQYVVTPAKFRCYGKDIRCVTSLNTLTREAYRGQKIFVGLAERTYMRAAEEGYAFCYGAPNQNSHHGFVAKLNFQDMCEFPLYMRPLNVSNMIKERVGNSFLSAISKPLNLLFSCKSVESENVVEMTEHNYHLMDVFWEKIKDEYNVIGVRDANYLYYRYIHVPLRKYYPYIVIQNGQVVAFAVGRIREVAHFKCGMIADFLYIKGYEQQAQELIEVLVTKMKSEGASLAGCILLSHTKEAQFLKKCRFFRCPQKLLPQPTPLILRVFDETINKTGICDIKNWFFSTGDYDVV